MKAAVLFFLIKSITTTVYKSYFNHKGGKSEILTIEKEWKLSILLFAVW